MPDPIEQLARYGAAVESATTATDVERLVEANDVDAGGTGAGDIALTDLPEADAGRSRRPWLIAAAVAAIVAIGATALVTRPDDGDDDDLEVVDDPVGETFGYGPGWHELELSSVTPDAADIHVWTGEELLVIGGLATDGAAAYDPTARTWRALPDPPLTPAPRDPSRGSNWQAAWTGEELVVVNGGEPAWEAASYRPDSDSWRRLPDPPEEIRDGEDGTLFDPDVSWTGTEVLFRSSLVSYVPATETWTVHPAREPRTDPRESRLLAEEDASVWAGDRVVYLSGDDRPTYSYEPATKTWREHAPTPVETRSSGPATTFTSGAWDGERVWAIYETGWSAAFDPTTGTWDATELLLPPPEDRVCVPAAVILRGQPLFMSCGALRLRYSSGSWGSDRHDVTSLISTRDALFVRTAVRSAPDALFLWVPPPMDEPEPTPTTGAPDTVSPTTAPPSTDDTDGPGAPDLIVTAGADETTVPPGASYCWAEPESTKPAVCVDMLSPDPDHIPVLETEVGVPLQVSLPGDNWTITEVRLPWADDGSGDCGLTRGTPTGSEVPDMPVLLTASVPPGTHTLRIEAAVAGNQLAYYVVIEAGDGPTCSVDLPTSESADYQFQWYGLTEAEAIEKAEAGGGTWRDISALTWPEMVGLEPDALGQVDLAFEDGVVRYAVIYRSGLPTFVEGVERTEDRQYLGLSPDEAYALATREGRAFCEVGGPCNLNLSPDRLQFHVAHAEGVGLPEADGAPSTVIGVIRR